MFSVHDDDFFLEIKQKLKYSGSFFLFLIESVNIIFSYSLTVLFNLKLEHRISIFSIMFES
jgi:hypothetical protein